MLQWKKINGELLAHAKLAVLRIGVHTWTCNSVYYTLFAMTKNPSWQTITYANQKVEYPSVDPDNPLVKELMQYGEFVFNPPEEELMPITVNHTLPDSIKIVPEIPPVVNHLLNPRQIQDKITLINDKITETLFQPEMTEIPETLFQTNTAETMLPPPQTQTHKYKTYTQNHSNIALQLQDQNSTLIILPKYATILTITDELVNDGFAMFENELYKVLCTSKDSRSTRIKKVDSVQDIYVFNNHLRPVSLSDANNVKPGSYVHYNGIFHKVAKVYDPFKDNGYPAYHRIIIRDNDDFLYGTDTTNKEIKCQINWEECTTTPRLLIELLKAHVKDNVKVKIKDWVDVKNVYYTGE